jgi:hypothetical protein
MINYPFIDTSEKYKNYIKMKSLKLVTGIVLVACMFLLNINADAQQRGRGRSPQNERNDQYENNHGNRRNDREDVYENRNQYQNRGHHYGNRRNYQRYNDNRNSHCNQNAYRSNCNHKRYRRMPSICRRSMISRRPRVHIQF